MATDRIATTHDLADALESVVDVLRQLPEVDVTRLQGLVASSARDDGEGKNDRRQDQVSVVELSERLPRLGREEAEVEVGALNVPDIRRLAKLQQIRIPSKATKSEAIGMLMSQLFDMPAGQELIRTFHKRNSRPPARGAREAAVSTR